MFRLHHSLFLYTLVIAQTLFGSCFASFAASVSSAAFLTRDTLGVTFTGAMGTGAATPANYVVSGAGAGNRTTPASVAVSGTDPNTYILTWTSGDFGFGEMLTLTVNDLVQDSGGAAIVDPKTASVAVPLGQWEFVSGTGDYLNEPADYTDDGNGFNPGYRRISVTSTDNEGNLWLFGGYHNGAMNDLWKFNTAASNWEYVSGTGTTYQTGDYVDGGNGVYPGSRWHADSWTDNDGNFWVFGGTGSAPGGTGWLNDLWKYNVSTGAWELISGTGDYVNEPGDYIDGGNGFHPGSRLAACTWTDNEGNLWLFGGVGYGPSGSGSGYLNDLWKYDIINGNWEFISGTGDYVSEPGDYVDGGNGVYPGSRVYGHGSADNEGNFWLFGGSGYGPSGSGGGNLNDLWKYDIINGNWEFISGTGDYVNEPGDYVDGGNGVSPGSRYVHNTWTDEEGNFYLFGGWQGSGYLNDFWKYDAGSAAWNLISGSGDYLNEAGTFSDTGNGLHPGSRYESNSWVDNQGNLWLFGGYGYATSQGSLNDLWKFNLFAEQLPPVTATAAYLSANELQITFSRPMGTGVTDAANYSITGPGAGTRTGVSPASVTSTGGDTYVITWTSGDFSPGDLLTLTVDPAIEDAAGDPIASPMSIMLMIPASAPACNCGP